MQLRCVKTGVQMYTYMLITRISARFSFSNNAPTSPHMFLVLFLDTARADADCVAVATTVGQVKQAWLDEAPLPVLRSLSCVSPLVVLLLSTATVPTAPSTILATGVAMQQTTSLPAASTAVIVVRALVLTALSTLVPTASLIAFTPTVVTQQPLPTRPAASITIGAMHIVIL